MQFFPHSKDTMTSSTTISNNNTDSNISSSFKATASISFRSLWDLNPRPFCLQAKMLALGQFCQLVKLKIFPTFKQTSFRLYVLSNFLDAFLNIWLYFPFFGCPLKNLHVLPNFFGCHLKILFVHFFFYLCPFKILFIDVYEKSSHIFGCLLNFFGWLLNFLSVQLKNREAHASEVQKPTFHNKIILHVITP